MNADLSNILVSDLVLDNNWDFNAFSQIFGDLSHSVVSESFIVDYNLNNSWIWLPKPSCHKISPPIYHHLNKQSPYSDHWPGWNLL